MDVGFICSAVAVYRGQAELDLYLASHPTGPNHRVVLALKIYVRRDEAIKKIEQGGVIK